MTNSQLFACFNKKVALYNKMKYKISKKHGISKTSFDVVMFLHNNSEVKTAEEICRMRGIKPAIVSVQIDRLIKDDFVVRAVDVNDRRRQLLTLSDKVKPITDEGVIMQKYYNEKLFEGVDPEEQRIYIRTLEKMLVNINKCEKERFDFGN